MKIYLGSDHGGFVLKQKIEDYLSGKGHEVVDVGCKTEESCDYPFFGAEVARKVVGDGGSLGISVCGSGLGISMAANKVKGARAAHVNSVELAELSRRHNGANILSLGERTKFFDPWEKIIDTFIETAPEEGRHERRRDQLNEL
jgi:ribose 5-phosphate isomerase B